MNNNFYSIYKYLNTTPPILLLVFNRPSQTSRVLEVIKLVKPTSLYIACDGPRDGRNDDIENIKVIKELVNKIDWCSDIKLLFRDSNLGCKYAISSAISWFMDEVGEGIILEDDCLPDKSFFTFCGEMLDRYRHITNVMQISGFNFACKDYSTQYDYHFSQLGWQWGWATWKRAWDNFDLSISKWPDFKQLEYHLLFPFFPDRVEIFDQTFEGKINSWAFPWSFSCAQLSGLSIVPTVNLVKNIGFGADATHKTDEDSIRIFNIPVSSISFPLKHPPFIYCDKNYDLILARKTHPKKTLFIRIKKRLVSLFFLLRNL